MFTLAGNLIRYLKKKNEKNLTILLLGLDNAGKTTLLFGLKDQMPDEVTPTIGFRPSTVVKGKYTIQWFDVGGSKNFRKVWQSYYSEVHGVIYVVDAADRERFEESKETLTGLLDSQGIAGKPVLIFANKQDIDGCATADELSQALGMVDRKDCRHNIKACCAKPPEGKPIDTRISTALKWLLDAIDSDYAKLNSRVVAEKAERDRKEQERRAAQKKRAEEAKAQRLREQAEAERLKQEQEQKGDAGAGAEEGGGGAHAGGDAVSDLRATAHVATSTPRAEEGFVANATATPVRDAAMLMEHETPGKEDSVDSIHGATLGDGSGLRPNKLPPIEVSDSIASPSTKPRLQDLKPMPPPVSQADLTLPNAMPSPVFGAQGSN